jgi:hypothetical protein
MPFIQRGIASDQESLWCLALMVWRLVLGTPNGKRLTPNNKIASSATRVGFQGFQARPAVFRGLSGPAGTVKLKFSIVGSFGWILAGISPCDSV